MNLDLYQIAKKLLSIDYFDKKRALAARKLFHEAEGVEKRMIGSLFESQFALAPTPMDTLWLQSMDQRYFSGKNSKD
jgi:hypothetical protein